MEDDPAGHSQKGQNLLSNNCRFTLIELNTILEISQMLCYVKFVVHDIIARGGMFKVA